MTAAKTIKDFIPVQCATFTCPECGKRTGWYRGVAANRSARVCEHIDPTSGKKCILSRRLLSDEYSGRAN